MSASAAKRISGWAANLFASGLILVAGLALGRQVLVWWKVDSAARNSPPLPAASSLGNPERPQLLEFGDIPFALRRAALSGSKEAVFAALREQARQTVSQAPQVMNPAGRAEKRMLARIGKLTPVAQEPGRWEIYELDGPILMVAGVRLFASPPDSDSVRRVVLWGLAVPSVPGDGERETAWTLFSFSAASGGESARQLADISLPAGVRRTLSLASDDGARLIGFRGPQDSAAWRRHFEKHFSREGAAQQGGWRETDGVWYGRFEQAGFSIDVQWNASGGDEPAGLITVTPETGVGESFSAPQRTIPTNAGRKRLPTP